MPRLVQGSEHARGGCKTCNSFSWICEDCKSSYNWMEVFDPKTQTWEPVLCPLLAERLSSVVWNSAVVEGRIYYFFGTETLAYDPKEDKWEAIKEGGTCLGSYCVIDEVLYCSSVYHELQWYDTKKHFWVNMKGLEGLPKSAEYGFAKLVDYGGKLAVLWSRYYQHCKNKTILCAVIVLERRSSEEIWGTVKWLDPVLSIPETYRLECALAPTV